MPYTIDDKKLDSRLLGGIRESNAGLVAFILEIGFRPQKIHIEEAKSISEKFNTSQVNGYSPDDLQRKRFFSAAVSELIEFAALRSADRNLAAHKNFRDQRGLDHLRA